MSNKGRTIVHHHDEKKPKDFVAPEGEMHIWHKGEEDDSWLYGCGCITIIVIIALCMYGISGKKDEEQKGNNKETTVIQKDAIGKEMQ